jgi:hypothetical protein
MTEEKMMTTKTEAEEAKAIDLRVARVLILEVFLPQLRDLIERKCMHAAKTMGMRQLEHMLEQIERAEVMLDTERAAIEQAKAGSQRFRQKPWDRPNG